MPLDVILLSIYGISCATVELYKQVKHLFHDLKPPIPKVSSSKHRLYNPKLVDDIRSEANDHYGFLARLKHKLEALGRWSWAIEMTHRVVVVMARVGALLAQIHALPQQPVPLPPSYFSGANGHASAASIGTSQWPPPVTSYSSGRRSVSSVSIPPSITRTRSQWPPPTMSSSRTRSFTQTTPSDKSTQWSSSSLSGSNTLASSSKTTTSQLSLPTTSYSGTPSKCTSSSSTTTRSRVRPSSTVPSSTNDRVARSSSMGSRTSSHSDTASFCSTRAYRHYSGISYRPTK